MKKLLVLVAFALLQGEVIEAAVKINAPSDKLAAQWFEELVPMTDGVKLYTGGVAPANAKKCPIVIIRTPYVKEQRTDMVAWEKSRHVYVSRGYACVFQHCRGCGMSEGDWVPYEYERADGLALLDFVRKLPWYNGEIFLLGASYSSSVHFSYLDTDPPDVKGASLIVQDCNRYNICYRNGFFKIGLTGNWFVKGYKKKNLSLKRDKSVTFRQFPLADFTMRYWGVDEPSFDNVLLHPREDDPFWASNAPGSGIDFRDAMLKSTMPVLLKTAFYDIYTDGVCAMWREMPKSRRANCSLVIDASNHSGSRKGIPTGMVSDFPGGARIEANAEAVDWFDSIRNKTMLSNAPLGKTRYYALWENAWITDTELVNGGKKVCLPFGEGVRAYKYDPMSKPPKFPGSGGICFGGMSIQPPPTGRDDTATFILPPISERMDVRGRVEAELSVSSDCEDSSFYIRVSVDKGDGKWLLLRDDIRSLAYDSQYIPGTHRLLRYRFADHAFRLEKGDRLRVDVAGASEHFAPHPNVKGDAFKVKKPKVANNQIFAHESKLVLFVQ
jgi:putative CocE/NonD family hydrolase